MHGDIRPKRGEIAMLSPYSLSLANYELSHRIFIILKIKHRATIETEPERSI